MLPSAPSTFKVRNAYSADINKLSYFLFMPTLQKGKSTEISARLYLILGMIDGTWSICKESLICIILYLFIWVLLCRLFHRFSRVLHQSKNSGSCLCKDCLDQLLQTKGAKRKRNEAVSNQNPDWVEKQQNPKLQCASQNGHRLAFKSESVFAELAALKTYLQL